MSNQRTIYASYLHSCLYHNRPFVLAPNSTLNQKLNINKDVDIPPGVTPSLLYFGVGNGGHRPVSSTIPTFESIPHRAWDAAMYNQVPLVLRETNNDLSPTQRARYALRKLENINGVEYYAYYLKILDLGDTVPTMKHTINENGTLTTNDFIPSNDNLNPVPPVLLADGTNPTEAEEVHVDTLTKITFDRFDRDEFVEVARILYNDPTAAIITELALCSAAQRQLSIDVDGSADNMLEGVGVQINYFVDVIEFVHKSNEGFELTLDLGGADPMIVEANGSP